MLQQVSCKPHVAIYLPQIHLHARMLGGLHTFAIYIIHKSHFILVALLLLLSYGVRIKVTCGSPAAIHGEESAARGHGKKTVRAS